MEFSSELLTEFGLNLAGYLIVAVLVYNLVSRRSASVGSVTSKATPHSAAPTPQSVAEVRVARPKSGEPVFVSLAAQAAATPAPTVTPAATRRDNRRAIYQEARRLLATGNSRRELLDRLPLTEDEIELLSLAGKA